jgi:CheY-like chemotaxis protein
MALILVIDDSAEFKGLIFDYLLIKGHKVLNADNGREGLKKAIETKPDLILMDVMMPDMGGFEALKELRADEDTRDIPVFIITGSAFDAKMNELFKQETNCREFLDKTIELSLLDKKITAALASRGPRPPEPPKPPPPPPQR